MKKLNLYAQGKFRDGFINHDLTVYDPAVDITFDINKECWGNQCGNQYDVIMANRALHYADSPLRFLDNAWKSLSNAGYKNLILEICEEPDWNDIFFKRPYTINAVLDLISGRYSALKWELQRTDILSGINHYQITLRKLWKN